MSSLLWNSEDVDDWNFVMNSPDLIAFWLRTEMKCSLGCWGAWKHTLLNQALSQTHKRDKPQADAIVRTGIFTYFLPTFMRWMLPL